MATIGLTGSLPPETKAEKAARMKWWHEARFGMFIHWGLYSIAAGEYKGQTNHAEWLMETAHVPVDEYEKYRDQFNPVKFDARAWAKMAHDAGMKYVVITTKHHDGFGLFDSKAGDYNVMSTPFKRDIMKELSTAVRAQGLTMGWYHSIMDWHHPDYFPARPWNPRAGKQTSLDAYNSYLRKQVTELLTNYGPIGVMWFDGEWERSWNDHYGKPLYELCRTLQPSVIVNNRVSNSRAGSMEDATSGGVGDFTTPEQYIPATGLPGVDWETCMTMNDHWGYNSHDTHWKSTETLVKNLVDVVSKGGNYLLNIGPKADGTFPQEAVDRLKEIGAWMDVNGESIYGTEASVFDKLDWGRSTTKFHPRTTTLYLHVFDFPAGGKLTIPGLANRCLEAKVLGADVRPTIHRDGPNVQLGFPEMEVGQLPLVVKLEIEGKPIVYRTPKLTATSQMFVRSTRVMMDPGSPSLEVRYTLDGSQPTSHSPLAKSPVTIDKTSAIQAAAFHEGQRVSDVATLKVEKTDPWPATALTHTVPGLSYAEYQGDWDVCPDWSGLKPTHTGDGMLGVPMVKEIAVEYVGRHYTGFIRVPKDDVYDFHLTSDDGSKLWIDGKVVVDHDGLHSSETKIGQAPLAAGWHRFEVSWFNKTGGAELRLNWGVAGAKPALAQLSDFCTPIR